MIVIMKKGATEGQIGSVVSRVEESGYRVNISQGEERTVIGIIGDGRPLDREQIGRLDGVERTVEVPITVGASGSTVSVEVVVSSVKIEGVRI